MKNKGDIKGMKVLVIGDVHLKPWIFDEATKLLKRGVADKAVFLGDYVDDWNQQYSMWIYQQTLAAASNFARNFPETVFLYGNHEKAYQWGRLVSGYSVMAAYTVRNGLKELERAVKYPLAFVHRIDNVIFSHGCLTLNFVNRYVPKRIQENIDETIAIVNGLGEAELWNDESMLWCRPNPTTKLYQENEILQVAGHTPTTTIQKYLNGLILCDSFSTYRDGSPIGSQEFLVVDTETLEYFTVPTKL